MCTRRINMKDKEIGRCNVCGTFNDALVKCNCAGKSLLQEVSSVGSGNIYADPLISALDKQHGGDHYKNKGIQPWEYIAANEIGFFEGNVIKYVTRHKDKNGIEDLKKAQHYLEFLIEMSEKKT